MENRSRFPFLYALITIFLGGIPFGLYGVERSLGSLSEEAWYGVGVNHGPWRGRVEGLTVFYPILILMIVTCGTFLLKAVNTKNWKGLSLALILVLVQLAFIVGQLYLLAWTID